MEMLDFEAGLVFNFYKITIIRMNYIYDYILYNTIF